MRDNNLVITTTEPKTFHFYLPKDAVLHLKHAIYSIIELSFYHNSIIK